MSLFFYEPFYTLADFDDDTSSGRSGAGDVQHRRGGKKSAATSSVLTPRMDLHEDAGQNIVTATFELPGLKKEDVNIEVLNDILVISGQTTTSAERDEAGYVVRERRFGKFERRLPLPKGIKYEDVKASLENGVLTVSFPRTSPEQAPQRITIS